MPLTKCIVLLPLAFNDGSEIPPKLLNGILRRINEAFDGHTIAGSCSGEYRMPDGAMAGDTTREVWVAVDPKRVEELRDICRYAAKVLKQETIYFEITTATIEFVSPPADAGND